MIKEKKIPMRQCVGCREMHPKAELARIVKSKEGSISLDTGSKLPGRGAYICRSAECFMKAKKARALERAFSQSISEEVYDALKKSIEEACNEE